MMFFVSLAWLTALSAAGVMAWLRVRTVVARTTLARGPWWWAGVSLAAVASVEWLAIATGATAQTVWLHPARFAAAATSFGPLMSIFGAQSPQERAWPWIVLSLWIVVTLPAAEVLVLQQGQTLEIHAARGAFLWLLIVLQMVQGLPTSFWKAGVLAAVGQALLLATDLPGIRHSLGTVGALSGLSCGVAALWVVSRGLPNREDAPSMNHVWLDFRDLYGTVWGLRVADRLNALAQHHHWEILLYWHGWQLVVDDGDDERRTSSELLPQVTWNLLRRFVDAEWFNERAGTRFAKSDNLQ